MGNKLNYFKIFDVTVPKQEILEYEEDKPKAKKAAKREPVTLPTELKELAEEAARVSGTQPETIVDVEDTMQENSAKKAIKAKKQLNLF